MYLWKKNKERTILHIITIVSVENESWLTCRFLFCLFSCFFLLLFRFVGVLCSTIRFTSWATHSVSCRCCVVASCLLLPLKLLLYSKRHFSLPRPFLKSKFNDLETLKKLSKYCSQLIELVLGLYLVLCVHLCVVRSGSRLIMSRGRTLLLDHCCLVGALYYLGCIP